MLFFLRNFSFFLGGGGRYLSIRQHNDYCLLAQNDAIHVFVSCVLLCVYVCSIYYYIYALPQCQLAAATVEISGSRVNERAAPADKTLHAYTFVKLHSLAT